MKINPFYCLLFCLGLFTCKHPTPPLACFETTASLKFVDQPISFEGCTEQDVTHEWDFGDGTQSSDPKPSHTYRKAGTYTVIHRTINEYDDDEEVQEIDIVRFSLQSVVVRQLYYDESDFPCYAILLRVNDQSAAHKLYCDGGPLEIYPKGSLDCSWRGITPRVPEITVLASYFTDYIRKGATMTDTLYTNITFDLMEKTYYKGIQFYNENFEAVLDLEFNWCSEPADP